jgi:hypothetical protein
MITMTEMENDKGGGGDELGVIGSCSKSLRKDVGGSGMFTKFRVEGCELSGMYHIVCTSVSVSFW